MPGNLNALGNMAAWVTSLVRGVKPRIDKISKRVDGWVDGWDEAGEIEGSVYPKDGHFDFKIKLPKRGQDDALDGLGRQ